MLDLHCHILPGIDDGPANWDQSLEMAHTAARDGIRKIMATPHFIRGGYEPFVTEVLTLTEELNIRLGNEGLDLEILPGMEVYLEQDLPQLLKEDKVLTLGNARKYLLVELPPDSIPLHSERVFFELQILGIMPIMAHAERNQVIAEDPRKLFPFVEKGILVQVTAASLLGHFGSKCRETAQLLLRHKLAHFIASDAHYMTGRMPKLKEARAKVQESMPEIHASLQRYEADFEAGKYIALEDPLPLGKTKKKGFWSRFAGNKKQ